MAKLLIKDLYKELNSNRLQLEEPTIKDTAFYRKAFSYNSVWKYISTFKISEKNIQEKITKYTTAIETDKAMIWKIVFENNEVGIISLHNWDADNKKAEIGYFILPNYQRKGIVSESIEMVINFAFGNHFLNRIEAIVYNNNNASNKTIVKNGFTQEAVLREYFNVRGVYTDIYLYSLLKKEWEE